MLTDQITYWTVKLKQYLSDFAGSICLKEKYGEDIEECYWINVITAARLIEIIECYNTDDTCKNCLCEDELNNIFQLASKIINNK